MKRTPAASGWSLPQPRRACPAGSGRQRRRSQCGALHHYLREIGGNERLNIEVEDAGGYVLCRAEGVLDVGTVGQFLVLRPTLADQGDLIIDLSLVDFLDSAGAGALVGTAGRVRKAGGRAAVVCTRPRVMRLLRSMALDRLLPVRDTVEGALEALRPAPSEIELSVYVETNREATALRVLRDVNQLVSELGYEPRTDRDRARVTEPGDRPPGR